MHLESTKSTVDFNKLSNKQLVCQALDILTQCLTQALKMFKTKSKLDIEIATDISKIIGQILERYDAFMDILKVSQMTDKLLIKSWLHQAKYIRNEWAHNKDIQRDLVLRLFQTCRLLFIKLKANLKDPLYERLLFFRGHMLLQQAKLLANSDLFR